MSHQVPFLLVTFHINSSSAKGTDLAIDASLFSLDVLRNQIPCIKLASYTRICVCLQYWCHLCRDVSGMKCWASWLTAILIFSLVLVLMLPLLGDGSVV
jgi:hypothetical protein